MTYQIYNRALAVLLTVTLIGCGGTPKTTEPREQNTALPRANLQRFLLQSELDRRFSPRLAELAGHGDAGIRTRVAEVMGHIETSRTEPVLLSLLDDQDTAVRAAAAASAGLQTHDVSETFVSALCQRAEKEQDTATLTALLWAIGARGSNSNAPTINGALNRSNVAVEAAALRAMAQLKRRGEPLPETGIETACGRLTSPAEPVRFAAAYLLTFVDAGATPDSCIAALSRIVHNDTNADVRIQAVTALIHLNADIDLSQLLALADQRIAAAGIALSDRSDTGRCHRLAPLLESLSQKVETDSRQLAGFLPTLEATLQIALKCRGDATISTTGERIAEVLDAQTTSELSPLGRRVHCLAISAANRDDLALISCNQNDSTMGKRMVIDRLARKGASDATAQDTLIQFSHDAEDRVVDAALLALAGSASPKAIERVVETVTDSRIASVASALLAIAQFPDHFRKETDKIRIAVESVIERGEQFDQLTLPMMLVVDVLAHLDSPEATPLIRRVADSDILIASRYAREMLLRRAPDAPQSSSKAPPKTARRTVQKVASRIEPPSELVIETESGTLVFALAGRAAPMAVTRLIDLATEGYYDNQRVQSASPGDGPLYISPPCGLGRAAWDTAALWPSTTPVERGTIAFRHTDTAKTNGHLFVARHATPELEGHITVLGRLVSGSSVLDDLTEGAHIERVFVSRGQ